MYFASELAGPASCYGRPLGGTPLVVDTPLSTMSTGGRAAARAARLGLAALRGGGRASAWPRRALAVQPGAGAWGGAMEAAGGAWARASRGFAGSPTAMSDGQEEK